MPRLSLWANGRRTSDYKFIDRTIREMFTVGGTSIFIHKYLGPQSSANTLAVSMDQPSTGVTVNFASTAGVLVGQYVYAAGIPSGTRVGAITSTAITLTQSTTVALTLGTLVSFSNTYDPTNPVYQNQTALNIQDLLLLENRDRKYDSSIYDIRGIYNVQDLDFDLSQFGLFLQNDTLFISFHLNDMVERLGRKIMSGDVLELPHLKDFYSLDESVPVALKRFYVVKDAISSAEGYSPTWWGHLWRVKATPLVDSQEYKQILNQIQAGTNSTLADLLSSSNQLNQINDAIITESENLVPLSGYNTDPFWIPPMTNGDRLQPPLSPDSSPTEIVGGYLAGDGVPPNGFPVTAGVSFPAIPTQGEWFLRTDFMPNRLFKYDGNRWIRVEDDVRTNLTPGKGETLRDTFVNNTATFTNSEGQTENSRQNLSDLLKPSSDF
jgi:hypothetical protein